MHHYRIYDYFHESAVSERELAGQTQLVIHAGSFSRYVMRSCHSPNGGIRTCRESWFCSLVQDGFWFPSIYRLILKPFRLLKVLPSNTTRTKPMRTLLIGLFLLTVACRRPSTQFSAMLTPVNQPDDYTRYLKAGDELVAVGSDPAWSLTVNPSKGVLLFKPQHGDSSIVSLSENQISRTTDSTNGAFGYQSRDGRIKVSFSPDSCTDKLSGQRYDYRVDVVSQGKNVVGCGVSLRQLSLLQDSWVLTSIQGDSIATNGPAKTTPRLDISLTQGRVTGTTGCNQLNGPASLGHSLPQKWPAWTRMVR
jgi:uncharacterized membrane protein